jgi:DNA helicase-2/ATP-dependent DNA helicase PcrA
VNTPKRGLGDKAQQKIQMTARQNGVSLLEGAAILLEQKGLTGKGAAELAKLIDGLRRWGRLPGMTQPQPYRTGRAGARRSGYTEMWQNDKTPEAPGRLENLKELVKALEQFENLSGFLEHVSLIMDNEAEGEGEKVSIMTLHAAKGLEFPVVFLPGWEDGLFPRSGRWMKAGSRASRKSGGWPMWASPAPKRSARFPLPGTGGSMANGKARCPRASSTNCPRIMWRC